MKVAVVGLGRVGSALAFNIIQNQSLSELILIDRDRSKAERLKMDIMSTSPSLGSIVHTGELQNAEKADIVVITAGVPGAPSGTSLLEANTKVMADLFAGLKVKSSAKIVVIATPVDKIANIVLRLAKIGENQVIGFGGQLDINRLKYLIYKARDNFSEELEVGYIGEHGSRGIPIFSGKVPDREELIQDSRFFFSRYLASKTPDSSAIGSFGPALELVKLIEALSNKDETVLNVSYFDKTRNLFVTWPCRINSSGVVAPIDLELSSEERREFEQLYK